MPGTQFEIRPAGKEDAPHLARFINMAGEGLPHYLWTRMAGAGEDAWSVGEQRACREEGGFSYRNARLARLGGDVAACLIGYALPPEPEPFDAASLPPLFVPLMELENLAPNSWYINVLAVYPQFRRRGLGAGLLDTAQKQAAECQCPGLSLIVSDTNEGAIRLYENCGFTKRATRPMVKEDWVSEGRNWVLMAT